jgi:membrane-associated phospholipid phosphatase
MTRLPDVRVLGAATAAVAAVLFAAVAWGLAAGVVEPWDEVVRSAVHGSASDVLTWIAFALSFVGSVPIWLSVSIGAVAIFWRLGWHRAAANLTIVMAGAIVLVNGLKLVFARLRPEVYFGEAPPTYSFPSGHAMFAACLYGALACLIADRIAQPATAVLLWCGAVLLAGAIGWSRIYLGAHYPSDVVAGYLVAIAWVGLVTAWRASDEN